MGLTLKQISEERNKSRKNTKMFKKRKSSDKSGVSNHKVCIKGDIDEIDQIFMMIAGTGLEVYKKMNVFHGYI